MHLADLVLALIERLLLAYVSVRPGHPARDTHGREEGDRSRPPSPRRAVVGEHFGRTELAQLLFRLVAVVVDVFVLLLVLRRLFRHLLECREKRENLSSHSLLVLYAHVQRRLPRGMVHHQGGGRRRRRVFFHCAGVSSLSSGVLNTD